MIASDLPTTEIDILAQVVGPDDPSLRAELARSILAMRFTDEAQSTVRSLLDKGNQGTLTPPEQSALDQYLRVGQFIDLLQAKARPSLQDTAAGV